MSDSSPPAATRPAHSAAPNSSSAAKAADCLHQAESAAIQGRVAEARSLFRAALDARPSPDIAIRYAQFLADHGEWAEAKSLLEAMLAGTVSGRLRAVVCHNLAALERESGDATAARFRQQSAVAAAFSHDSNDSLGTPCAALDLADLIGLAADQLAIGDLATTTRLLDAARRSARAAGDLESLGDVWGMRGVVSLQERRLRRAVRDFHTAARLHRAARDPRSLGIDLLNLAETYRLLGRFSEASRFADRAARSFKTAGAVAFRKRAARLAADVARIIAIRSGEPSWN